MVQHGGSSASLYLADPTSPIPSHCASILATSTLRVNHILHWLLDDIARMSGSSTDTAGTTGWELTKAAESNLGTATNPSEESNQSSESNQSVKSGHTTETNQI